MKKQFFSSLLCLLALFLLGCDRGPTSKIICDEHPSICQGLNTDGWCVPQREEVIFSEYELTKKRTDARLYRSLQAWGSYGECIELASHVEMKRLKIRQSERVGGYVRAEQPLKELLKETRQSSDPYLLWYHWSKDGNKASYNRYVALEGSGKLNTPELILNLAAHYADLHQQEKAISYLLEALSLYKSEEDIDPKIYRQMTTLTYQIGDYQHSYLWALITKAKEAGKVDMDRLDDDGHLTIYEKIRAQELADSLLDEMSQGHFKFQRTYQFKK